MCCAHASARRWPSRPRSARERGGMTTVDIHSAPEPPGRRGASFKPDLLQSLHGRAPAVATGVKRMVPDAAVVTLQGDGDMVSEGLHEVLHAAARAENVTALLFNNGVFGDTGGHMTATTVLGQRTKTSLEGRDATTHGYPIEDRK